ncbi:MAG: alpha/beta fold hydrolase [Alphaproteobacteria bacterium]|nr:alpha/beta fold hydrolase [Alphaproteobacteria bacterium]
MSASSTLRRLLFSILAGLLPILAGCATPVQVQHVDPRVVHRELTSNVISTGDLSEPTQIVLHREALDQYFDNYPEQVITNLHRTATAGKADPDALFALSELSFRHAEDTGKPAYYLASAVYAFAFLFPEEPARRPDRFDPRVRIASDLYNRSLTSSFASADRSRVLLQSGGFELPFGTIDITFNPTTVRWGNLVLSEFTPLDALQIQGLQNRYRQRGIGAPLAAGTSAPANEQGFRVLPEVKVPVTALLRIDMPERNLAQGHLRGNIEVYPAFEPSTVTLRGQSVPLEVDTSAAFAYGLSDPKIWRSEIAGFLSGDYFNRDRSPIDGLEPYHPGQIPVIFIHGTASSSGRWANLVNDLQADPVIREHFQFWWFSYSTGNPMPYSALRLRKAIEDAVHRLDPQGKDPALRQIVLIGHSQGGLLAKMLVIDSGSRLWNVFSSKSPEELQVSAQTRDLLHQALFVKPVPEVRRVIFMATPQQGSFVAGSVVGQLVGRLVRLPLNVVTALGETVSGNPGAVLLAPGSAGFGSMWSMTPGNPALAALAAIPVFPNVAAHSIIAVKGNGPVETGDDGVVSYRSAHIPEAKSELVVRSGHSMQDNPYAVAEVRRILLLHLKQSCPQGCALATAPYGPISGIEPTGNRAQSVEMAWHRQ